MLRRCRCKCSAGGRTLLDQLGIRRLDQGIDEFFLVGVLDQRIFLDQGDLLLTLVNGRSHGLAKEIPGLRRPPEKLHRIMAGLGQKIPIARDEIAVLMQRFKSLTLQRFPQLAVVFQPIVVGISRFVAEATPLLLLRIDRRLWRRRPRAFQHPVCVFSGRTTAVGD
ncbi:hypothetical protein EB73_06695 [Mycobacterium sp. SWH-M3]|nr:hypothetical protein EB73_06695 [Mycobacterium sp. SWH-M3]